MPVRRVEPDDGLGHVGISTFPASAGTFTYTAPTHVTKVPTVLIEGAVRNTLNTMSMHLNNLGPAVGQSRQLDNSSSVTIGADSFAFSLPEEKYALRVCVIWCHTFGEARFYVNDVNLNSRDVHWNGNGLDVNLGFESSGREAKGFLTDSSLNGSPADDLMPDVNIDDAKISTRLVPVALNGKLSCTATNVVVSGTVQATGPCDLLGFDPCDFFGSYKNDVKSGLQLGASAALNSAMVKAKVESQLASTLAAFLGITTVTRVRRRRQPRPRVVVPPSFVHPPRAPDSPSDPGPRRAQRSWRRGRCRESEKGARALPRI